MTKCVSPWYNHPGWLGIKHQFTYLLTFLVMCFEPSGDFLTVFVYVCLPTLMTFLVMCSEPSGDLLTVFVYVCLPTFLVVRFELTGDFLTVLVYVCFQLQNLAGSVDTLASKVYWGRGGVTLFKENICYRWWIGGCSKKTFVTGNE